MSSLRRIRPLRLFIGVVAMLDGDAGLTQDIRRLGLQDELVTPVISL